MKSKDYTGAKFGVNAHLEVTGWSGEKRGNTKLYTVRCSVCAQDPELFGDGTSKSSIGALSSGIIPCGCSSQTRWTEQQNIVRVKRYCKLIGYDFTGFVGEYVGSDTHVGLKCLHDGYEWNTSTISHLLNHGRGCPHCGGVARFTKEERESQIAEAMTGTSLNFVKWLPPFMEDSNGHIKNRLKFVASCSEEGHDDFSVSVGDFLNRDVRCPICAVHGFNRAKPAHVYVLRITGGTHGFTGYGISNEVDTRLVTHKRKLREANLYIADCKTFSMHGQKALNVENAIKGMFERCPQIVEGFRTEATHLTSFNDVLDFVEKMSCNTGDCLV